MRDFFKKLYDNLSIDKDRFDDIKESNLGDIFPRVGFLTNNLTAKLEATIGVKINNRGIFEAALTHKSYLYYNSGYIHSYERLEFLGDSILGFVVAEYLFFEYKNQNEGILSPMRANLVNSGSLELCNKQLGLVDFIQASESARKVFNNSTTSSILGDVMEAIIAAVYLDSGFRNAKKMILNKLLPIMLHYGLLEDVNYKSVLLETVQADGKSFPTYEVIEELGPAHNKIFKVAVLVEGETIANGVGRTKKEAEKQAAQKALEIYNNNKKNEEK